MRGQYGILCTFVVDGMKGAGTKTTPYQIMTEGGGASEKHRGKNLKSF